MTNRGLHYLYGTVICGLIWQGTAWLTGSSLIPSPIAVLGNLSQIFLPQIGIHGLFSLWRIVAGVCLAIAVGVPLGLCMGYFAAWDRALAPIVYLSYPVPKIALLPLIMLLFGLGDWSKIFMVFLIIIFQVIVAVRDGVKSIPKETYYPLYSLGAGFPAILREILIPASLPKFLTALRIAMATAISVLFFTETFGTQYGMGYFIMDAWLRINYLEMYSGIVVLSGIGLLVFTGIDWLERKLCHWQYR